MAPLTINIKSSPRAVWLKGLPLLQIRVVTYTSSLQSMSAEAIKAIEEESNKYVATVANRKVKNIITRANPNLLISPFLEVPAQDIPGTPSLGERVMNIRGHGAIPFGLQGLYIIATSVLRSMSFLQVPLWVSSTGC